MYLKLVAIFACSLALSEAAKAGECGLNYN
jgi:hypothetical protein